MHSPAPFLENDTHKFLEDFDIHTDHRVSVRKADLIIINNKKRTCRIVDFTVLADDRVKLIESKKNYKYLDFARKLKKTVENENDGDTNCNWYTRYSHQRIGFVSLFNGISTFQEYLMLNLSFWKNSCGTI